MHVIEDLIRTGTKRYQDELEIAAVLAAAVVIFLLPHLANLLQ